MRRISVPAPRVALASPGVVPAPATASPSGFGRWLLVLAAGLVLVCVLGYRLLRRNEPTFTGIATPPAEPTSTATATEPASAAATSVSAALPAPGEPAPLAGEPTAAASNAAAEPGAAPETAASAAAPTTNTDVRRVTVQSKPPKVRFFHFGKLVGVTPFVLELKPGERHSYEAGLPGYGTRKVMIDGSRPEITIGLRREKP